MIRASSKVAAAFLLAMLAFAPRPASATLEADPQMLYRQMKDAFARGDAHGWTYADQVYYLSTIFNAGRAYALQRPDDPAYGELATLTVQIGGALHYNPLIDYDAAAWYVREACRWVEKNSTDFALISASQALTERIDAEDNDPEALARMADEDALAIAHQFPHDVQAELMPLDADWRAWTLTHDTAWRTLAFERVAQPGFPIANLPDVFGAAFVDAAQGRECAGLLARRSGERRRHHRAPQAHRKARRHRACERRAARRLHVHPRSRRRVFRPARDVGARDRE